MYCHTNHSSKELMHTFSRVQMILALGYWVLGTLAFIGWN